MKFLLKFSFALWSVIKRKVWRFFLKYFITQVWNRFTVQAIVQKDEESFYFFTRR